MIYLNFPLIVIYLQHFGTAKKYISNLKFEKIHHGTEDMIKDFVTLANDPNGNLPNSFTVCSSLYVKYCTSNKGVLQMLKQDGSPWYSFELLTNERQYETKSEKMIIWYENPSTGKTSSEAFSDSNIPIVPHSW